MPGDPFATLEGWAVAAANTPRWDHTYVTSSCGYAWGCWGRFSGGISLGSGTGSSFVAECLSQPNSEAGIRYLRTGVCHQTANRILHPAAPLTVSNARGYPVSVALFGVYGLGAWPAKTTCYASTQSTQIGGTTVAGSGTPKVSRGSGMLRKQAYDQAVYQPSDDADDGEAVRLRELYALVQLGLGRDLSPAVFRAVAERQAYMRRQQEELVKLLDAHRLEAAAYADRLRGVLESWADDTRGLIGSDDFRAIFGDSDPPGLVDKDVFLAREGTG